MEYKKQLQPQTMKIPFCLTTISKMELNIVGLSILTLFPSNRLDSPFFHTQMLLMSSNERFRQ